MIQRFVDLYMSKADKLRAAWSETEPQSYLEIVQGVVKQLESEDPLDDTCPRVSEIIELKFRRFSGDYFYLLPCNRKEGSSVWWVAVEYGSCSACDTMQSIDLLESKEERLNAYMTLALHVVQEIKQIEHIGWQENFATLF
jgi:hypothetical protein